MRLREPKATALIFGSGKLVITGTKSSHNSSLATKKIAYILERIGFRPDDHINFKVQNIVGTVDCGFPIRLEGVAFAHPTYTSYEPELFPGLIYRLSQPKVVLLVFVSGKVVITGAKTEESLVEGLKRVFPMLLEFRKVHVAGLPGTAATTSATINEVAGEGILSGSADIPSLPPMDTTMTTTTATAAVSGKGKRGGTGGRGKAAPRARRGKDLQNVGK